VHILLATDADWIVDEVTAALGGPDTTFTVCREGRTVAKVVAGRVPDLAILDLQVGSMGGMAITMDLRLDESSGRLPHVSAIMLLDRHADLFLAQRSGADGWLIKPLDPLRLRRAMMAVAQGGTYTEGLPAEVLPAAAASAIGGAEAEVVTAEVDAAEVDAAEEEPATAG
jgi:DNA-binding response OmpR family regulator